MPNKNIVGRFAMSGIGTLRHSSTRSVRIYSSGAVISVATLSRIFGDRILSNASKSFTLRYGASMKSCA